MQTLVTEPPYGKTPTDSLRKKWTRDDCIRLDAAGAFGKLELIDGELIDRMGTRPPHQITQGLMIEWLMRRFGYRRVRSEIAIDVRPEDNPSSEPEPDVVLLARDFTEFRRGNPQPADVLLLVEVSDTTLGLDLKTKASLYARAGIVEYWVMDVNAYRVVVHRDPRAGRYSSILAYGEGEEITSLAAPDYSFSVADAFGPTRV